MSSGIATWIRLAVLGSFAVAVAAFLGWQAGQIPVPATPPPAPTPWALPPQASEDLAKDLAILAKRRPWSNPFAAAGAAAGAGQPGAGPAPSAEAAGWRLAGLVERPGENFALILTGQPGAAKLEDRRVGDLLPDGSTLVQVTPDRAVVTPAGSSEHRTYWLFRGKPR